MNARRLLVSSLFLFIATFALAQGPTSGWADVDKKFGRPGTVQSDVYKVTFPRSDLNIKIGEVPQVYYMHFYGRGARQMLAQGLRAALDKSKTPISVPPPAGPVKSWDT